MTSVSLRKDQQQFSQYDQAIKNLSKMLPQLTAHARTLTNNPKVKVKVGRELSYTDGKEIFIRPPLALAGKRKHEAGLCDSYDELGRSRCSWCHTRQTVMTTLEHELGHILGGSFKQLDTFDVRAMKLAAKNAGLEPKMYASMEDVWQSNNDLGVISLVSALNYPQMQYLMLMTEDIRCNETVFQRSPVQLDKFRIRDYEFLNEGIEEEDGSRKKYIECNNDAQITVASYMQAFEHEMLPEVHFSQEVMDVINLQSVQDLTYQIRYCTDVVECAELTFALAKIFRENGFYKEPEVMKLEMSEEEYDEFIKELIELLKLMMGHGTAMHGHDCSDGDAHVEQGSGSGTIEIPSEEQSGEREGIEVNVGELKEKTLDKVISSMWYLDRVPIRVAAPKLFEAGTGEAWGYDTSYYGRYDTFAGDEAKVPEQVLGKSVSRARLMFEDNKRVKRHRNQRSGRVTGRVLARRVPFDDDRVFETKIKPDKRDYAVLIGIDISGSTAGMRIKMAKKAALGQAEICARTGVSFAIYAHSTYDSDDVDEYCGPAFFEVKKFDEPWTNKQRDHLTSLQSVSGNLDGHSLQFYRKQLDRQSATDKILLYYTDGAMPATNYDEELRVLQDEIKVCQRRGYTLLGVGIQTDSPKAHGLDTVQVNSDDDILAVVEHLGKRLRESK